MRAALSDTLNQEEARELVSEYSNFWMARRETAGSHIHFKVHRSETMSRPACNFAYPQSKLPATPRVGDADTRDYRDQSSAAFEVATESLLQRARRWMAGKLVN